MNLRDHDAPCGHGHWFSHVWMGDECPGGAAVVIDYEAAGLELDRLVQEGKLAKTTEFLDWDWSTRVVGAALGPTDESIRCPSWIAHKPDCPVVGCDGKGTLMGVNR